MLENCPAEVKKYASAKVFMENCDIAAEAVKGPVLVCDESESKRIQLSDDEASVLSLGQKFCILNDLGEDEFLNNLEQCIIKYNWDRMGEEIKNKNVDPADIAISAVLSESENESVEEELRKEDAKQIMVFDRQEGRWDYSNL